MNFSGNKIFDITVTRDFFKKIGKDIFWAGLKSAVSGIPEIRGDFNLFNWVRGIFPGETSFI